MAQNEELIEQTVTFVKETLEGAEAGHDWWHTNRVRNTAINIALKEGADLLVVEISALLHDIADSKFHDGDEEFGPKIAHDFLKDKPVSKERIEHILQIIRHVSFKNSFGIKTFDSLELQIVQDADRLDAIGAIGIARAFNYGGFKNRIFYDPETPPQNYSSGNAYQRSNAPTINHFYEKLLKLKDMMNTKTGRELAEERHQFMELFLKQFYKEWSGE